MKSVLIAGSDGSQTEAWRAALEAKRVWHVLGPVKSLAAARLLLHRHRVDLAITGPRVLDGDVRGLLAALRDGHGQLGTPVMVVGGEGDDLLVEALREGVDHFFDPAAPHAGTLADAAADALTGQVDVVPWIASRLLMQLEPREVPWSGRGYGLWQSVEQLNDPLALTPEERQLLRQLAMGRRVLELARQDGLAPRALLERVRAVCRKVQWDQRAGALNLRIA